MDTDSAASKPDVAGQVRAFVEWVGAGRKLPHLTLIVELAKAVRLIRKTGNQLVPVKRNKSLLDDAPKLGLALFAALDKLGDAFLPSGFGESLVRREFALCVRAILTSLYRADGSVPASQLCAMTWAVASAQYFLDDVTELGQLGTRRFLGEPEPGDPVCQVKITPKDLEKPLVWRRVLVPAAIRLDELHEVVQAAMGWQNAHMHAFIDAQTYYGVPDPELQYRDEHATRLNDLVRPGGSLEYTYDFGDSWDHEILIEEATVLSSDTRYPRCVAGESACPPEDAGGCGGYLRLLGIGADPGHKEHRDVLDWLDIDSSTEFDPTHFDLAETNLALAESSAHRL